MCEIMTKDGKAPSATFSSFLSHRQNDTVTLTPAQKSLWQTLFARYLNLIGVMLAGAEDMSLVKLLNEVSGGLTV